MTRLEYLTRLDAYYGGTQYDALPHTWDQCSDDQQESIPFRKRKPSTIIPLPRILVDSFVHALWGAGRKPTPLIDNDAEIPMAIVQEAKLYRVMREMTRRALTLGSGVVAWRLLNGRHQAEAWDPKFCTPTFTPGTTVLEAIDYTFTFCRELDGKEKEFQARQVVDKTSWTVYKPVEVIEGREPIWTTDAALSVEHKLGFTPVVWFTIGERGPNECDGTGIYASFLSLFDDLNYTASQQARAMYYNLDPVTVVNGMRQEDMPDLEAGRAWGIPKEAEAKLLESTGSYITQAQARIDSLRKWCLDAASCIVHDAEKIRGAQSGTALELLYAPMLAQVDEFRSEVGDALTTLIEQMLAAWRSPALAGRSIALRATKDAPPDGTAVTLQWGRHFAPTPQDALTAAQAATAAARQGLVSRSSAARYMAPFLGVMDVEADQADVDQDNAKEDTRIATIDRNSERARGLDVPPWNEKETEDERGNEDGNDAGT